MELKLKRREAFNICGFLVETDLENCQRDLSKLWKDFKLKKQELFNTYGYKNDFYGLMWTTENKKYIYLIGIEVDDIQKAPHGAYVKIVPEAQYAALSVPSSISAVEAWTKYYEEILPKAKYVPHASGKQKIDFEYYPEVNCKTYELWTPVIMEETL